MCRGCFVSHYVAWLFAAWLLVVIVCLRVFLGLVNSVGVSVL